MKSIVTRNLFIVIAMAVGLLPVSGPVFAHHGVANLYDMSKAVTLKGTITKFVWTNPHNQIFFDVTDESAEADPEASSSHADTDMNGFVASAAALACAY